MNLAIAVGLIALAFVIWALLPDREERPEPPPKESENWSWPPR